MTIGSKRMPGGERGPRRLGRRDLSRHMGAFEGEVIIPKGSGGLASTYTCPKHQTVRLKCAGLSSIN